MSSIHFNLVIAYTVSFLGTIIYASHIMSRLLCLEDIILSTFIFGSLIILNSHYLLSFTVSIIILVFAAWEAAIGIAFLVIISNIYGIDYVQNKLTTMLKIIIPTIILIRTT